MPLTDLADLNLSERRDELKRDVLFCFQPGEEGYGGGEKMIQQGVLDLTEIETLAALCKKHEVICVTDEVYDRLVFDGEHIPMASLPGMRERTVTINSTGTTVPRSAGSRFIAM